MNEYEARQEARRQRLEQRADKAEQESQRTWEEAREMASRIPMGQPILVGHHSEKADRRYRERIDNKHRKSIEQGKKAQHYRERAASVGTGGVSSDDPDAVDKLREQLEKAEAEQAHMKAVNKALRLKDTAAGDEALAALGLSAATIERLRTPDDFGAVGFARWQLTNNGANIRRLTKRIEDLEARAGDESSAERFGDIEVLDNVEDNRVQIDFPGKPSEEVRQRLKRAGFRWARSLGVWQRHRGNHALAAAREIAQEASS